MYEGGHGRQDAYPESRVQSHRRRPPPAQSRPSESWRRTAPPAPGRLPWSGSTSYRRSEFRNRTCQLPPIFVLSPLPFKILLEVVKEIFLARIPRQSGMVEVGRFWAKGGSWQVRFLGTYLPSFMILW